MSETEIFSKAKEYYPNTTLFTYRTMASQFYVGDIVATAPFVDPSFNDGRGPAFKARIIEKNYDYVGDKFTEEAKKIKYGEIKERPIYGEASLEQTKELLEEEINIMPLPWSPSKKNN